MIRIIAQGVVFRRQKNGNEFLVLKRVPEDGGFWQAVTGTIEKGEQAIDAIKRELAEETGISETIHISDVLEEYSWDLPKDKIQGKDLIFAVEVSRNIKIKIDQNEHSEFRWLPLEEAVNLLKYEGNKKSMMLVSKYAENVSY